MTTSQSDSKSHNTIRHKVVQTPLEESRCPRYHSSGWYKDIVYIYIFINHVNNNKLHQIIPRTTLWVIHKVYEQSEVSDRDHIIQYEIV